MVNAEQAKNKSTEFAPFPITVGDALNLIQQACICGMTKVGPVDMPEYVREELVKLGFFVNAKDISW